MTLDELDRLLAAWKTTVDTTAQELVELHNLPAYEILIGQAGSARLKPTGITATRIAPALAACEQVIQKFGQLTTLIDRAVETRKQIPRFVGAEMKIREIETLLSTPNPVTPRQLAEQIHEGFRVAREGFIELDRAWAQLNPRVSAAAAFLQSSSREKLPILAQLRERVEPLRARVMTDPFGAQAEFDREVQPIFDRAKAQVETLVRQREQVHDDFSSAHDALKRIRALREESRLLYAEFQEKITGYNPPTPPLGQERVQALVDWLATLEEKLAEGAIDQACAGLEKWHAMAADLIACEQRARDENAAPLQLRRELRGRLGALKAKALARGFAEEPRMAAIADRANQLLHDRPTPLKEAADLVVNYERLLNQAALK